VIKVAGGKFKSKFFPLLPFTHTNSLTISNVKIAIEYKPAEDSAVD